MQKTSLKWSILIWSIFLSLLVITSFSYISLKVNKNIKLNTVLENTFNKNSNIKNAINSWDIQTLWDWEFLKITDKQFILNDKEILEISFSWNINWIILLENGGPLKYSFLTQSWLIVKSDFWQFSWNINSFKKLRIENLWWIANFSVSELDKSDIVSKKTFTIYKNIWWKKIEKNVFIK